MAAKPVKVKKNDPSLLGTLEKEVAPEASPLLLFMIRNARIIIGIIVLFVVIIAGYGAYTWREDKALTGAQRELVRLTALKPVENRVGELEKFLDHAPEKVRPAVLFALIDAALQTQNHDKVAGYWEALEKTGNKDLLILAGLGKARAEAERGDNQQALAILNGLLTKTSSDYGLVLLNTQIVSVAEDLGDLQRATDACAAIVASSQNQNEQAVWRQKGAALRLQLAARK